MSERDELRRKVTLLADFLPKYYNDLELQNHCYRRIAYDMAIKDKWQNKVEAPFVENATLMQLKIVVGALEVFLGGERVISHYNEQSLKYRKDEK